MYNTVTELNFVHKKLFGAAKGFVTSGFNPLGAVGGFFGGGGGGGKKKKGQVSFAPGTKPGGNCMPGFHKENDICVFKGSPGDMAHGGSGAVMGQFGAALGPMVENRVVRECLPGMVLGKDGLCYNKSQLTNKERMYPRGTRPLGTPGEMAALRKAAAFGRRMETTVKRMQKIGVLKKASRGRAKAPAVRRIGPGNPDLTIVQN